MTYFNEKNNELLEDIESNTEYLSTVEGDEYPCITIENLKGILKNYNII